MAIDFSTEHGQRTLAQLGRNASVWLVTVSPSGEPQPNPVWFVWENDSFLFWSMPNTQRLRNIEANPKVSICMAADSHLHHITVFNGIAEFDESIPELLSHPAYMEKYKDLWGEAEMTPEEANRDYTVRLRVRPTRMRGY